MHEKSWPLAQQEINQLLENHGIVPTMQRLQIAKILFSKPQHLSADQLMDQLNTHGQRVAKATLYNTLGLFSNKGVINSIIIDPQRIIYDTNTEKHFHFYNQDTGELTDIHADELAIRGTPKLPAGTELVNMDVVIRIRQSQPES